MKREYLKNASDTLPLYVIFNIYINQYFLSGKPSYLQNCFEYLTKPLVVNTILCKVCGVPIKMFGGLYLPFLNMIQINHLSFWWLVPSFLKI